jgi:hypothetical protein
MKNKGKRGRMKEKWKKRNQKKRGRAEDLFMKKQSEPPRVPTSGTSRTDRAKNLKQGR